MRYRKKPVVIEAIQWRGDNWDQIQEFVVDRGATREAITLNSVTRELEVRTLEDGILGQAKHVATINDWLIQGVKGEWYFCKPVIFAATYEAVTAHDDGLNEPPY